MTPLLWKKLLRWKMPLLQKKLHQPPMSLVVMNLAMKNVCLQQKNPLAANHSDLII